ncbi:MULTISPECIES: glycoside hydrolase family 3 protein [unclassified Coleofasciculus]|uniref:glycoside hydrolase family 3 protein n=1 Tax=unclassified Coleofasciculus TaxID=2692782 RepID=UPI00187E2281|nr:MULTISPECIES: glycoside hydrolase family 3 N-terminal domain-containing protein [unclassified Coleofasciculus]MBE9127078.1 beta-glucosidase [Coleofasciculus sp. LEGE 07081]MBE9150466.1 beta-glucosidase [Coleofasciculus sp. LEGE 07092]
MIKPLPDFRALSLEAQVAQMVVVRASGYLFDHQIQYPAWEPPAAILQRWVQDLGIGGVILLGGSAAELAVRSQQLQNWATIPLFIAADIEEGVGQRFTGATWFPPPMAIGAIARNDAHKAQRYAQEMGAITAKEALAIGINWILAPVADVNNNPQNPVINVRAFGETPETVSQLACSFIQGTQDYPILTAAKHFPGHGDTATDSHLDLPVLPHSSARLNQVELPPFKAAIAAGVDAVMTAHLLIPAWDEQYPATLSKQVLTQLLRTNLEFEGLIITDALVMGAIANRYGADEAPVLAVEAGADILLMPSNPETAIPAVCNAVTSGRISHERILSAVERIWRAKHRIVEPGLVNNLSQQNPPTFLHQLSQPATLKTVTNILQDSQRIGGSLPLPPEPPNSNRSLRNLIVVDDSLTCKVLGRQVPAVAIPQQRGYELQLVDRNTPFPSENLSYTTTMQPTLLQLFIRGNPFRGTAGLTAVAGEWFKRLLRTQELQALVIYGSPYVLEQFLPELSPAIPYVFSYGQTPTAQAIALEALFPQAALAQNVTEFI